MSYPSMPLFVKDYLVDTAHLTLEQSGVYLHLLMHAWARGGTLPDDDKILASLAKVSVRKWKAIRPAIEPFWIIENGTFFQKRLAREMQYVKDVSEKRAAAGRAGARGRHKKKQQLSDDKRKTPAEQSHVVAQALTPTLTPIDSSLRSESCSEDKSSDAGASQGELIPLPQRKNGTLKPEAVVFSIGIPLLKAAGDQEKTARSFLGGQIKKHGAVALSKVLTDALEQQPVEPKSWIIASLRARDGPDDDAWQARISPDDEWRY